MIGAESRSLAARVVRRVLVMQLVGRAVLGAASRSGEAAAGEPERLLVRNLDTGELLDYADIEQRYAQFARGASPFELARILSCEDVTGAAGGRRLRHDVTVRNLDTGELIPLELVEPPSIDTLFPEAIRTLAAQKSRCARAQGCLRVWRV